MSDTFAHEIAHTLAQDVSANPDYDDESHYIGNPNNLQASGSVRNVGAGELDAGQIQSFKDRGKQYT